jgi:hypothetical protein
VNKSHSQGTNVNGTKEVGNLKITAYTCLNDSISPWDYQIGRDLLDSIDFASDLWHKEQLDMIKGLNESMQDSILFWIQAKSQIDSALLNSPDSVLFEDFVMRSNFKQLFAITFGEERRKESLTFSKSEFFYLRVITAFVRSDKSSQRVFLKGAT